MKRMKVLAFIVAMNNGGAQKVVFDNALNFLSDSEIDFKICPIFKFREESNYEKELKSKGVPVKYITTLLDKIYFRFFPSKKKERIIKLCSKYIKKENPDIVHVHLSEAMLYVPQAAENCNVPLRFYSLHSNPFRQTGEILGAIQKAFDEQDFTAICLNNVQYEQAKDYYKIRRHEILRNGIDFKNIRRRAISKEEARACYGLQETDFVISCVGRLDPIKNCSFMLDVMKIIVESDGNAKLLFAGDGQQGRMLKQKAKDLGIAGNTLFLGHLQDVVPVYCASDVFCITSITEASSLVLLEAQAVKLYCVVSDGVPSESIVSSSVKKMPKDATAEEWAAAICDKNFAGTPVCTEAECDVSNAAKSLKRIYTLYHKERDL